MARATGYSYSDYYEGYVVTVYCEGVGSLKMCEMDEYNDWVVSVFKTKEEAQKAMDDYNEVWNGRR